MRNHFPMVIWTRPGSTERCFLSHVAVYKASNVMLEGSDLWGFPANTKTWH